MKMVSLITVLAVGLFSVHVNIHHAMIGDWHPGCDHAASAHHHGCGHSHSHGDHHHSHAESEPDPDKDSHSPCCHDHHEFFARAVEPAPVQLCLVDSVCSFSTTTAAALPAVLWVPVASCGPLIQGKHPPQLILPLLI